MSLTKDDVRKIAFLARIRVPEDRLDPLQYGNALCFNGEGASHGNLIDPCLYHTSRQGIPGILVIMLPGKHVVIGSRIFIRQLTP